MILSLLRLLLLKLRFRKRLKIKKTKYINKNVFIAINDGTIEIGRGIRVYQNVRLSAQSGGKICIGDNVSVNSNDVIVSRNKIIIGNNVGIGPNVSIYDHDHNFNNNGKIEGYKIGTVEIGNNVWIGAGTVILRNTKIGDNTIIGAGCIVKGDIPANSLVKSNRELLISPLR